MYAIDDELLIREGMSEKCQSCVDASNYARDDLEARLANAANGADMLGKCINA